ncbi:MAG: hypothetical protein WCI92_00465 [Bacteroidota bacterium]
MITRVEWETYTDKSNSRIIRWDDNEPCTYEEMVEIMESMTPDKVKKIYPYVPKPMYLNLYGEIYFDNQIYKQRLILHLSQKINIKTDRSLAKIKCFGKSDDTELIYESIRLTYHSVLDEENETTLYFEEFKTDNHGKPISILKILMGINQIATHYSSTVETPTTPLEQLLLDSWDELLDNNA